MIKGISFLRPAGSAAAYDRLARFFSALGFAMGRGWKEETNRGASFVAPLGNLEFVDGPMPATADVCIEVTSLDAVHQAASAWCIAEGLESASGVVSDHRDPLESARVYRGAGAGHPFTFWAWTDPARGKPIAIEGDLSAAGMRFAIVVARWNAVITERLLEGALDALLRSGASRSEIEIVRVPGAWEIPAAARTLADLAEQGGPGHTHRSTPSSPSAACCAERPPTTKPSTTKWRAASASRSRRPAFPTASACSPAKRWSRRSIAPASRPATRDLKQLQRPSRW